MKREGGRRRALRGLALAVTLVAFACSSRHRLGRLEGDEATGAGGSHAAAGAGAAAGSRASGGTSATSSGHGHAGDGASGDSATTRPEPGVFVAQ